MTATTMRCLDVPYMDTRASQLRLRLGPTSEPALLTRILEARSDVSLRLEVLGSSHRLTLRVGSDELVETVACDPAMSDDELLPTTFDATIRGMAYGFRATIDPLPATATQLCADLIDQGALVGVFPGHPGAFTAVLADNLTPQSRSATWRTWHAYPQSGELVRTTSTVRLAQEPAQ